METEKKVIKKDEIIDFVNSLKYGSFLVKYHDEEARLYMKATVRIFNALNGDYLEERLLNPVEVYDEVSEDDSEVGEWYRLLYKIRMKSEIMLISNEDVDIIKNAELAKNDKRQVIIKMNPGLQAYAAKLARINGIKLIPVSDGWIFSGEPKIESAYKQMQRANLEGKDKIEFDLKKYSSQTVRCYASALSSEIGKKVSVKISEGKITVRFKEQKIEEALSDNLNKLYEEFSIKIGIHKTHDLFKNFVTDKEFDLPEMEETVKPTDGTGKTVEVQPLLLNEDGQFKIPETEEEEEEEDDF